MEILLCLKSFAGIEADQNNIQLRFAVADIESVFETGLQNGGIVIENIQQFESISFASFRDPDGNSIELIQR